MLQLFHYHCNCNSKIKEVLHFHWKQTFEPYTSRIWHIFEFDMCKRKEIVENVELYSNAEVNISLSSKVRTFLTSENWLKISQCSMLGKVCQFSVFGSVFDALQLYGMKY